MLADLVRDESNFLGFRVKRREDYDPTGRC